MLTLAEVRRGEPLHLGADGNPTDEVETWAFIEQAEHDMRETLKIIDIYNAMEDEGLLFLRRFEPYLV